MTISFASLIRRVIPRYTATVNNPPSDFEVGEIATNFLTKKLLAKGPNEVLEFLDKDAVTQLLSNAQTVDGSIFPRIIYSNNAPVEHITPSEVVLRSCVVPGGLMRANSRIDIKYQVVGFGGALAKVDLRVGGVALTDSSIYNGYAYTWFRQIRNRGSLTAQICNSWGGNYFDVSGLWGEFQALALNTAQNVLIEVVAKNTNPAQKTRLESFEVVLWP
jgi:hypothetical protein